MSREAHSIVEKWREGQGRRMGPLNKNLNKNPINFITGAKSVQWKTLGLCSGSVCMCGCHLPGTSTSSEDNGPQ